MGIVTLIVLGGIAGWISSIIMGGKKRRGLIFNIVVGIIGAFLGGFVASHLGFGDVTGINIASILIATLGACLLEIVVNFFGKRF